MEKAFTTCTHCYQVITQATPRKLCWNCTAMTVGQRCAAFPHVRNTLNRVAVLFGGRFGDSDQPEVAS